MHDFLRDLAEARDVVDINIAAGAYLARARQTTAGYLGLLVLALLVLRRKT